MKKLLLSLGALSAVVAPVAAVVACGDKTPSLDQLKATDIAVAKDFAAKHPEVTPELLKQMITEINASKSIADLTSAMSEITDAQNNGSGATDNGGDIDTHKTLKAKNLSVKANAKPDATKLPTTSWYSTVTWDRNMFLFEDGTDELNAILSATGTKIDISDSKMTTILTHLKTSLRAILENSVAGAPLYSGVDTMTAQKEDRKSDVEVVEKLKGVDIELMAHNGPFTSIADAQKEGSVTNAGTTDPKNIIFEILYVKPSDMDNFLDNLNTEVKKDSGLTAEELAVWKVILTESKASL